MLDIIVKLVLAIIAFLLSQWLLGLAGLFGILNLLISIVIAVIVFFNVSAERLRIS